MISLNAYYDDDENSAADNNNDSDHLCHYVLALLSVFLCSGRQFCLDIKYHCHIASFAWILLLLKKQSTHTIFSFLVGGKIEVKEQKVKTTFVVWDCSSLTE